MIRIRHFRALARAEAVTGVLLALTLIPKYGFDDGRWTAAMGLVHGVIFLAYFGAAVGSRSILRWRIDRIVVALAAAFVPTGTWWAVERVEDWTELERRERAGGGPDRVPAGM